MKRWLDSHHAASRPPIATPPFRLQELGVDERRDDLLGEVGAHERAHDAHGAVLGVGHRPRADDAAQQRQRRADGHGRRHEREHREERHLRRVAQQPR
jgi:hypothetical protein